MTGNDNQLRSWLNDDVAPVYDTMIANPEDGIPLKDAISQVRAGLESGPMKPDNFGALHGPARHL